MGAKDMPEIVAMKKIAAALEPLDERGKLLALAFFADKYAPETADAFYARVRSVVKGGP